ncbi:MAG: hypothetical protein FJX88_05205 [Bacteroidetes bacterium]|nr:hypothetical protein [Bacteroidota bacterium]
MKPLFIFLTCCSIASGSIAQNRAGGAEGRSMEAKKLQAMEMAFITKELNLTPDEAQKFWPVFNQYRNELRSIAKNQTANDQLENQQKMLDVRKRYREDFSKCVDQLRANKVFGVEAEFRNLVRREFQKRESERANFERRK